MKISEFTPILVESAPARLEPGLLYISIKYHTVLHLCACGCNEEIVTPLAPDQWHIEFDGASISMSPSIGNFRLPCHSHYFIRHNQVVWVPELDLSFDKVKHKKKKKKKKKAKKA